MRIASVFTPIPLAMLLLLGRATALAGEDAAPMLDLSAAALTLQPAAASQDQAAPAAPRRFGSEGSWWISVGGGVGSDLGDNTNLNLFGGISYFIVDDVEILGELDGWYFSQENDDALGLSPILDFRWHFLHRETWTLFAEIGIGILAATDDVPEGGTSVDFTPRLGMGWTQELDNAGTRLVLGLRWQHFSNARINGDDENPALDEPMLFAGLIFPF